PGISKRAGCLSGRPPNRNYPGCNAYSLARILAAFPDARVCYGLLLVFLFRLIPEDRTISDSELAESHSTISQLSLGTRATGRWQERSPHRGSRQSLRFGRDLDLSVVVANLFPRPTVHTMEECASYGRNSVISSGLPSLVLVSSPGLS